MHEDKKNEECKSKLAYRLKNTLFIILVDGRELFLTSAQFVEHGDR